MEEKTGRPMRPENYLSLKRKVTKHSDNHITKPNKETNKKTVPKRMKLNII